MNRFQKYILVVLGILILVCLANAQLVVKQRSISLQVEANPEAGLKYQAMKYLDLPLDQLKQTASTREETESVAYFRKNDFAFESKDSQEGRMTVVADSRSNTLYTILWDQKTVMKMSAAQMNEVQKQSENMMSQMMQNIPPEMQEEMKKYQKTTKSARPKVVATGKTARIGQWNCEQYVVEKPEEILVIWAAADDSDLRGYLEGLSKKMEKMMPDEDEEDQWSELDYVPGKIPVETRSFKQRPYDSMAEIEVETMISMERTEPPAEKFKIPGKAEGFTEQNLQDMMKMMPGQE